jgi:aspartate racemase
MKLIGLIGGLSWESTAVYYRVMNQRARERLGPPASARCLLWSFEYSEMQGLQRAHDWPGIAARLQDAAKRLEGAGADLLLICSNTMHRSFDVVSGAVNVPLLHIADPVGAAIKAAGHERVGLLGTRATMEESFYRDWLRSSYGLDMLIPDAGDRDATHRIIHEELVAGIVSARSRETLRQVMARLVEQGAQAIILGCTEIMLLVSQDDSDVPLFDTTTLHAEAAVDQAIFGPP